jgi:hypothetical protein
MSKEQKYQNEGQSFLEKTFESYNGSAIKIFNEEFSENYNDILQESSPIIGGKIGNASYNLLKQQYGIVGLREKINELNKDLLVEFLKKYNKLEQLNETLEAMFQDFNNKFSKAECEAEMYQLIFAPNIEIRENLKRQVVVKGIKEPFYYNVIYYETPGNYQGKNNFYTIRERRIPILAHQSKKTERPDFLHYINGIPLILIEYKTEDSGLLQSIKDFEFKESYRKAPFKIGLNDGRDVIFFSDIKFLKFKNGKDNSFNWVHYLPEKKYWGSREYTNIEYLFDELLCKPENLYSYCMDCCSVTKSNSDYYLINSRIQQYYAIQDIKKTLNRVNSNQLSVPYNFEVAHAQRSGKTITMKLITYMIEKSYKSIFNTIFMYTPDLQIKSVINTELSKSGNSRITVKAVESRTEYQQIIDNLYRLEQDNKDVVGLNIYIVNMQKITDKEFQEAKTNKVIKSSKILNIIDEAHHGQTKETALIRDSIFPNASNYLFTATGKNDMYLYYFPDNKKEGFCSKFTISNAKQCKITVPVMFLKADKHFKLSEKLPIFTQEVEKRMLNKYKNEASIIGMFDDELDTENYLDFGNKKVSKEIKKLLEKSSIPEKLEYIINFMNALREGLPFFPKAIIYANSIEEAKKYIEFIQTFNSNNEYAGYRFGIDFSTVKDICEEYNPGITNPDDISANFQKDRTDNKEDSKNVIDVLIAVDKYQKGFDLPSLLVTFLDTNISEPARMNQIFTRSATKFTGKTTGYCVDLTFNDINKDTYTQSLYLYDNLNEVRDSFIDDEMLDEFRSTLSELFIKLKKSLSLSDENFTSNMILQQVLNEVDLKLRQSRQFSFFNLSKNIISNMSKMGSPLFFKPFKVELKALNDSFLEFKKIYADKLHPEHSKILINTDNSFDDGAYITTSEINAIIAEVLLFLNEHNIKEIVSFNYKNTQQEVVLDDKTHQEVVKKFSQELKKNNIEKELDNMGDYLSNNYRDLFDIIKEMLARISNDRSLVYQDLVQDEIIGIEKRLESVKLDIANEIKEKYNGNSFLFWSNQVGNQIYSSHNINNTEFISYMSNQIYSTMSIVLPEVPSTLNVFNKVQEAIDMFKEREKSDSFSFYLSEFSKVSPFSQQFKDELKKAPKVDGKFMNTSSKVFNDYLTQTLRQYYQNLK